jgi:hypothetical protein
VGGARGDALTLRKDLPGGQGVTRLQRSALDGTTEVGANLSVRARVIGWHPDGPPWIVRSGICASGRTCGHAAANRTCGALVGLRGPGGEDAERGGAAAAVAEAAGDGADVNAGADQFGGAVVPQILQSGVNAEAGGHPLVALSNTFWIQWSAALRVGGEDVAGRVQLHAKHSRTVFGPYPMLAEDHGGLGVEDDAALLVGLGVLLHKLTPLVEVVEDKAVGCKATASVTS